MINFTTQIQREDSTSIEFHSISIPPEQEKALNSDQRISLDKKREHIQWLKTCDSHVCTWTSPTRPVQTQDNGQILRDYMGWKIRECLPWPYKDHTPPVEVSPGIKFTRKSTPLQNDPPQWTSKIFGRLFVFQIYGLLYPSVGPGVGDHS